MLKVSHQILKTKSRPNIHKNPSWPWAPTWWIMKRIRSFKKSSSFGRCHTYDHRLAVSEGTPPKIYMVSPQTGGLVRCFSFFQGGVSCLLTCQKMVPWLRTCHLFFSKKNQPCLGCEVYSISVVHKVFHNQGCDFKLETIHWTVGKMQNSTEHKFVDTTRLVCDVIWNSNWKTLQLAERIL